MSKYLAWAIQLSNGKFVNDAQGQVGPATFETRREARAWWSSNRAQDEVGKVVPVTVTVKVAA